MGPKLVDFGVLVDLGVAYFDIQGLKSDPQNGPFWTPPGDPNPEGPNMTMGGSDGDTVNAYALAMAPWAT